MTHVHGTIRLHDNMFMILRHCSSYRAIHLTMYVTLEVKTKKFRCGFKEPYSSEIRNHIHVDKYIKVISGVSNTCELNTANNIHLLHDII